MILHTVACTVPQDTSFDQQVPHRLWDRITLENHRTWTEKKGVIHNILVTARALVMRIAH